MSVYPGPTPESAVYERLFARCPALRLSEPWSFVPPSPDCRGCVADPPETLAALQAAFDLPTLQAAGVMDRAPDGNLHLDPSLCDPDGAIIALRTDAGERPFELLTARGCVSQRTSPLLAALYDRGTAARVRESGRLLASFRIREVALLRALGLPGTLCTGLHEPTLEQLRTLDDTFGEGELGTLLESNRPTVPPTGEDCPELGGAGTEEDRVVALLGWDLLTLSPAPPVSLEAIAACLDGLIRHLNFVCDWLAVWRLSSSELETLRYRLRLQRLAPLRAFLEASAEHLYELCPATVQERPPEPEARPVPANFAQAQANLVVKLAGSRVDRYREAEACEARQVYEELVRRDLIRPLQEWALASTDPVVRNAGAELANICVLLHEISPSLQGVVGDQLRYARGPDGDSVAKLLTRYLQLNARFAGLVKTLWHLSKQHRSAR